MVSSLGKESGFMKQSVKNAIYIGTLCAVAYLAVYIARNALSAVTPQMIEFGFTEAYIGSASSIYFIFYAVGQLINGLIGDRIKARHMLVFGLFLAGVANASFPYISVHSENAAVYIYGLTGFFLSMIYAPMTKVVAENTEPLHATRCSLGYTFSSFFGSPVAGVFAAVMTWQWVFYASSIALWVMSAACLVCFLIMEKKGIVKYGKFARPQSSGGSVKELFHRQIVKFTMVSLLTGIIRTTVVFWMPTYFAQYLGFSSDHAALLFTVSTLVISATAFITVFVYEKLGRNMDKTVLLMFIAAAASFGLLALVKIPAVNVALLILGIMAANGASSMLWSIYCPSLADTGMVSSVTGFLDFVRYMAAAVSSTIFANAVTSIGWGNLILIWCALMVVGVVISLPYKKKTA